MYQFRFRSWLLKENEGDADPNQGTGFHFAKKDGFFSNVTKGLFGKSNTPYQPLSICRTLRAFTTKW